MTRRQFSRQFQCVIKLNAEVANRAIKLSVPEQQLNGADIAGLAIDDRGFRSAHGMGAVRGLRQADHADPAINNTAVLPCGDMPSSVLPAGE